MVGTDRRRISNRLSVRKHVVDCNRNDLGRHGSEKDYGSYQPILHFKVADLDFMKIGRRTQAYFVGFIIGVVIVSIIADFRRNRLAEAEANAAHWERISVTLENLPVSIVELSGAQGHVTAMEKVSGSERTIEATGYFFANGDGKKFWYLESPNSNGLHSGELLLVTSRPGLEADLMEAGLKHQGHEILESNPPTYTIRVQAGSASAWIDEVVNLQSKANYIASVDWIPVTH